MLFVEPKYCSSCLPRTFSPDCTTDQKAQSVFTTSYPAQDGLMRGVQVTGRQAGRKPSKSIQPATSAPATLQSAISARQGVTRILILAINLDAELDAEKPCFCFWYDKFITRQTKAKPFPFVMETNEASVLSSPSREMIQVPYLLSSN